MSRPVWSLFQPSATSTEHPGGNGSRMPPKDSLGSYEVPYCSICVHVGIGRMVTDPFAFSVSAFRLLLFNGWPDACRNLNLDRATFKCKRLMPGTSQANGPKPLGSELGFWTGKTGDAAQTRSGGRLEWEPAIISWLSTVSRAVNGLAFLRSSDSWQ
jgi:hypothetical protein